MPRRPMNHPRATDRLNQALLRISVAAEMIDSFEIASDKQSAAVVLRKQLGDALDEAHAALSDIRHAAGSL